MKMNGKFETKTEIKSPTTEFKLFLDNLNFCYTQFCYLEGLHNFSLKKSIGTYPLSLNFLTQKSCHCSLT